MEKRKHGEDRAVHEQHDRREDAGGLVAPSRGIDEKKPRGSVTTSIAVGKTSSSGDGASFGGSGVSVIVVFLLGTYQFSSRGPPPPFRRTIEASPSTFSDQVSSDRIRKRPREARALRRPLIRPRGRLLSDPTYTCCSPPGWCSSTRSSSRPSSRSSSFAPRGWKRWSGREICSPSRRGTWRSDSTPTSRSPNSGSPRRASASAGSASRPWRRCSGRSSRRLASIPSTAVHSLAFALAFASITFVHIVLG